MHPSRGQSVWYPSTASVPRSSNTQIDPTDVTSRASKTSTLSRGLTSRKPTQRPFMVRRTDTSRKIPGQQEDVVRNRTTGQWEQREGRQATVTRPFPLMSGCRGLVLTNALRKVSTEEQAKSGVDQLNSSSLVVHGLSNSAAHTCSILLIFTKADKQTRMLEEAAQRMNLHCKLVTMNFASLETTTQHNRLGNWVKQLNLTQPVDLVIIDRRRHINSTILTPTTTTTSTSIGGGVQPSRHSLPPSSASQSVPADAIRQELSELVELQDAVVAALIPSRSMDKRNALIMSTFEAGYNKCLFELATIDDAARELLTFFRGELPQLRKSRQSDPKTNDNQQTSDSKDTYKTILSNQMDTTDSSSTLQHTSPNLTVASTATKVLATTRTSLKLAQVEKGYTDASNATLIDALTDAMMDSISSRNDNDKRMKAYVSVRRRRGPSRSIPGSTTSGFDQEVINRLLGGRNRESTYRFSNLNTAAPLCKVIAILNSSKARCPNLVSKDLQKAIDLICQSDTFIHQLFKPMSQQHDPLTVDLIEGLMSASVSNEKSRLPRSTSIAMTNKSSVASATGQITRDMLNSEEVKACLEGDARWDFDIIELERVTQKRPLTCLAMHIFTRFDVFGVLRISEDIVASWLEVIQQNYHPQNPYHNATHAADVMQSCACLMRLDAFESVFDGLDEAGSLLAAVVHDLDHPARTNPFLINSNNSLALFYNDTAVLESHHVALAFDLTRKDPNVNIFQNLTRDEYRTIRGYIIDMVLATEMARHFDHVSKFVNNLTKPMMQKNHRNDRSPRDSTSSIESTSLLVASSSTSQLTSSMNMATTGTDSTTTTVDNPASTLVSRLRNSEENRAILKRLIIKCSDVNNQTRSLAVCKEWAGRIAEEYFCQTEEEKTLGLPIVMPSFDRQTCNIPKSQISFIDFFLKDMFQAFNSVCPIPELMNNLQSNYEYWEQASQPVEVVPEETETPSENKT